MLDEKDEARVLLIAQRLAGHHLMVEDCWYSCPMSGDCANFEAPMVCDCGYEDRVAAIAKEVSKRFVLAKSYALMKAAKDEVIERLSGEKSWLYDFIVRLLVVHEHRNNQVATQIVDSGLSEQYERRVEERRTRGRRSTVALEEIK